MAQRQRVGPITQRSLDRNQVSLLKSLERPTWRNWIARMTSNHKVAGSSPAVGDARLAQSVERQPFKLVVVGSSPTLGKYQSIDGRVV